MQWLEVQEVGHRYGRHILFRRLSLVASRGESWAITGPNGSGKSTLLKILAGLVRPTRGKVILMENNRPVPQEDHPLRIGIVAPYINVYDDLTLRENLAFVARVRSMQRVDHEVDKLVKLVGLSKNVDQPLGTYSTGMTQRARLAAALIHEPNVLLLGEPTLGLDEHGRSLCTQIVTDLQISGCIIVIASNAASDIALAKHTVCIKDYATLTAPQKTK